MKAGYVKIWYEIFGNQIAAERVLIPESALYKNIQSIRGIDHDP